MTFRQYLNHPKEWNDRAIAAGRPYAVLPVRPFRTRLRFALKHVRDGYRERIALRIAPWLRPEEW